MPETTMNEHDCLVLWQNDIRATSQPRVLEAEAEARAMQGTSYYSLGSRILRPYPGHHSAAGRRIDYISQFGSVEPEMPSTSQPIS